MVTHPYGILQGFGVGPMLTIDLVGVEVEHEGSPLLLV